MTPETPAATPAPAAPVAVTPTPAPSTPNLSEFEAHKVARGYMDTPKRPATIETPAAPETPQADPESPDAAAVVANPLAGPPEPAEEPEPAQAEPAKGPEAVAHKWKDPDTGVTLDMRRRDHRRIRKLLEERADLARRVMQPAPMPQAPPAPEPQRMAQPVVDPNDPEPTLDQFAEQPDPYAAFVREQAKWAARQEHHRLTSERTSVERVQRVQAAIESAQQAFDAKLPEIRQRYPDFDQAYQELHETLARVPFPVRAPIVTHLLRSGVRHELAYYLGHHPEALHELVSARSRHAQALALGAIEAQVKHSLSAAPAQASTTRAPAPTTPVNTGSPAARRTPEEVAKTGDYQAYRALRGMPATAARG